MTILFSAYTDVGVVFGSDDRITSQLGKTGITRTIERPPQQKLFEVSGMGTHPQGGLLGFFGSAMVNRTPMDQWLRETIPEWRCTAETSEFAADLRDALKHAPFTPEQRSATGFHTAAFERRDGFQVPVFHFVSNIYEMQDGYYTRLGPFQAEEQLLGRDLRDLEPQHVRSELRVFQWSYGQPRWYRNGDVPFLGPLTSGLMNAVAGIVQADRARKRDEYQVPSTLEGWKTYITTLVETTIDVAALLFVRGKARIGGEPLVRLLEWPASDDSSS